MTTDRREGPLAGVDVEAAAPRVRPGARRVVAAKPRGGDADALLADARVAMGHELARLKNRAAGVQGLDPNDVKALALLTDAACKLAREEREALKADDLAGLTNEELKAKTAKAMEELDG